MEIYNNENSMENITNFLDDWDIFDDAVLIRVHGCVMLTAWVGAGSIGILISRYLYCFIKFKLYSNF